MGIVGNGGGLNEAAVLQALKAVKDPDLQQDVVTLGFVKDLKIEPGKVSFCLELTTPACPVKDQLKAEAERAVSALAGVQRVDVRMTFRVTSKQAPQTRTLIPEVRNTVAVASGKGGVGKSTVAANLAVALMKYGARVGLMDADVYGPSIPILMGASEAPQVTQNRIIPPVAQGVKMISMGYFLPRNEAVIWRGPMLHKMIQQFLGEVEWGELDYLVIDLPPGTGDIQLSLCQTIPLTGAVIVSTPQDLALEVASKAIAMFKKLNTPILGVVENMSYYVCSHCGQRDEIFGHGGARKASERLGYPFLGEIPLDPAIRTSSDSGQPAVLQGENTPYGKAFLDIASATAAQISIANFNAPQAPVIEG
ncbi:MAG: Mrp/NBP35 family ATP-binding protein [Acidobacteria bacterium]|nr:Mrp/NBP35 family ATP-binding protein [Acidobacteriota bacterium]